jgi:glyoxylase-like metal-dependent hydrolase (beta-lactamase superfamily II)
VPAKPPRPAALVLAAILVAGAGAAELPAAAQSSAPGLRLYVLDCGTVIYNHPESYNLTREEVGNTNMSVSCYLVVHPRGALLFDTGLPDAMSGRPFNESPLSGDPKAPSTAYFMLVTKPLSGQLASIGFTPDQIDYLALSHAHRDHVGNANDYAASTWLAQQAEHDAMFGPEVAPASVNPNYSALRNSRKQLIEGDHDVFGDGTVVLKHTPGHTPGHQSLYVKLPRTGGIVLSGDLYHYPEERALDRMPEREKKTATAASRRALEAFMTDVGAQLWIGHDINANSRQKKAPEYYD